MNRLPAEWELQSGVLLTWPNDENEWRPSLEANEAIFVEMAYHIAQHEKVIISCLDDTRRRHITARLQHAKVNLERVKIYCLPSIDVWVRDHGPITVLRDNKPVLLNFIFNGWGNKYEHEDDNLVTENLATQHAFGTTPIEAFDLVLEGGSIEVDGQGTLLTTKSCLLNPNRNPSLSQAQIEQQLKSLLGLKRILWLEHGDLRGDDTDGHIDTLARFCDPHTICYVSCDDKQDEHFECLLAMQEELTLLRTAENKPYKLIPLPLPQACFDDTGRRLPAAYANFLIINNAVLVPTYNDPQDDVALERLKLCFPQHKIIPINSVALINQYGSLHCASMQLPKGVI